MVEIFAALLTVIFGLSIPALLIFIYCEVKLGLYEAKIIKLFFQKETRYRKWSIISMFYVGITYVLYLVLYCTSEKSLIYWLAIPAAIAYILGGVLSIQRFNQKKKDKKRKRLERIFEEVQ